jgi:hypothetical protein
MRFVNAKGLGLLHSLENFCECIQIYAFYTIRLYERPVIILFFKSTHHFDVILN